MHTVSISFNPVFRGTGLAILPRHQLARCRQPDKYPERERFAHRGGQAGFALVSALLVTLIIVLVGLSVTFRVRQRLGLAEMVNNRVEADLEAWSTYQELLFLLTTTGFSWYGVTVHPVGDGSGEHKLTRGLGPSPEPVLLNFYGDRIVWDDNVTVTLRDVSSLLCLVSLDGETDPLGEGIRRVLQFRQVAPAIINSVVDSLADWQDEDDFKHINGAEKWEYNTMHAGYVPRNHYCQSFDELLLIRGINRDIFDMLRSEATYAGYGSFNYMNASAELLRALLTSSTDMADRIVDLRSKGMLTPELMSGVIGGPMSGEAGEYPADRLKMTVESRHGDATARITAIYYKDPTAKTPFQVELWQR